MARRSSLLSRRWVERELSRRGGWIGIAVLILVLVNVGWSNPATVAIVVLATLLHFLLWTPVYCGAETRDETACRNNARGLLMGCHLQEHQWQKMKMAIHVHAWRKLARRVFGQNPAQSIGTLAAVVASMAAVVQTFSQVT